MAIHGFVNSGARNWVPGGSFEGGLRESIVAAWPVSDASLTIRQPHSGPVPMGHARCGGWTGVCRNPSKHGELLVVRPPWNAMFVLRALRMKSHIVAVRSNRAVHYGVVADAVRGNVRPAARRRRAGACRALCRG